MYLYLYLAFLSCYAVLCLSSTKLLKKKKSMYVKPHQFINCIFFLTAVLGTPLTVYNIRKEKRSKSQKGEVLRDERPMRGTAPGLRPVYEHGI